jgi:hypothetical protein
MTTEPDPVRSLLEPLRAPWEHAEHRNRLEAALMKNFDLTIGRSRFLTTSLALVAIAAAAAALPAVRDWWQGWTSKEEVLPDGRKRLIVTDPNGRVDFDEVLNSDDGVFLTDQGEYVIVEDDSASAEANAAAVDAILAEPDDEE